MKNGSLNLILIVIIFFNFSILYSQEKIKLEDLQPTFEEEADDSVRENENNTTYIKTKTKKKNQDKANNC